MPAERAFAKINLSLDILGRRDDGYHDLEMVMQTVSLWDVVTVEEAGSGFCIAAEGFDLPSVGPTMEQRAAEAFFARIGRPMPPLSVRLKKEIPAYAGLGGGSADVAALLRLLRRQYCPQLSCQDLRTVGLMVGSDMPFCIQGGTALVQGRGERVRNLAPLPQCAIVLCKPPFNFHTAELFSRADGMRPSRRPDTPGMVKALEAGDLSGVAQRLCNVFEGVLLPQERVHTEKIRQVMLCCGALEAAMSGSGPTMFGLFPEEEGARRAAALLKEAYPQTFLAAPVAKV